MCDRSTARGWLGLILLLGAGLAAQSPMLTLDGLASSAPLTPWVARVGDVNLDGRPDVGIVSGGSAQVRSGADGSLILAISPPSDSFFVRIDAAGDIDADGNPDVLIGVQSFYSTDGAVRAYSGLNGTLIRVFYASAPSEAATIPGGRQWIFAALGDVNMDGFDDVICGRRGGFDAYPPIGSCTFGIAGAATVFSGQNGAILSLIPGQYADPYPTVIRSIDDVDGDGIRDFVIGSTGNSYVPPCCFPPFCFAAPPHPLRIETRSTAGSLAGGGLLHAVQAPVVNDLQVKAMPDVTGDGFPDLLVGIQSSWSQMTGLVPGFANSALYSMPGFASDFAPLGDQNGDGIADFLVGLAAVNQARIHSGTDGMVLGTVTGPAGTGFGSRVSGVGDLNLDGVEDFAVAGVGQSQDTVTIYSGATLPPPTAIPVAGGAGAGGFGAPLLQATTPMLGGSMSFALAMAEPQRAGVLIVSPGPAVQPPLGGIWAVDWTTEVLSLAMFTTGPAGDWNLSLALPSSFGATGLQFTTQAVVYSTAGGIASNGIELLLGF